MKSLKVGVIIPSYNQGRFIEQTLVSAIENRRNADIEIAVVDGGSEDGTVEIIKKYEGDIAKWCSERDGGQAAAINKGIAFLPDCDYYMWLNSDDVYESDHAVADLLHFAQKEGYQVCYGKSHFIDEDGNVTGEYPVEVFDAKNLGIRCFLSQPSVMFSRAAYEKAGGINEELGMCLDYEYWIRLAKRYEFGFYDGYIGATRMYEGTKTAGMQRRHLNEAIRILNEHYGKVPIHWIAADYIERHPSLPWKVIPKRLLMLALLPVRKRIVRRICKTG